MKVIIRKVKKAVGVISAILLVSFTPHTVNNQPKPAGKPWPAPASAISVKNPVKSDAVSIKDGKTLYIKNCQSCHGDSGKGDGTKAKNLDISCGDFSTAATKKMSDGELYWKITEGRKPMPTFGKKLTDTERWSIVNYVRTLAK